MRAIEQRNAQSRAALFAKLFRGVWNVLRKAATRLSHIRLRRRP